MYEVVDYFVITELFETFSGKNKPFLCEKEKNRYKKYSDKIIYNPVSREQLEDLKNQRWSHYVSDFDKLIPYQNGGKAYRYSHESIKREVNHKRFCNSWFWDLAEPDDYILLSDLDEIPNPLAIKKSTLSKIKKFLFQNGMVLILDK